MTLVLDNVNVVDVETGGVTSAVSVVVADDRIAAITTDAPADVHRVDAGGAYVVPGFNDMHAHPLELADPSGAFELMVAYGVTGFRQMSGSPTLLAKRRAGDFAESADAPSLLLLCGDLLTPLNASTAEDAVKTVRAQQEQGADFVKMGMVSNEVYGAAQAEANRVGIPLGGHLPTTTVAEDAAAAGIRFVEHLGPGLGLIASCAADPAAIRTELAALKEMRLPSAKIPGMAALFGVILKRIVVNPQLRTAPEMVAIMRKAIDSFSDERAAELAGVLIEHETWQCPTLIREKTNERGDDDHWHGQPENRYMSGKTRKLWGKTAKKAAALPAETRAVFHDLYDAQKRLAKILADAGVPMITGSDVTGASWEVPGASLHQEFDELASAGLSPLQVLTMTTTDAARFADRDDLGRVAPGMRADLVLLREDPVHSVAALHTVIGVVRNGAYRSESDLAAIKDRIAHAGAAG